MATSRKKSKKKSGGTLASSTARSSKKSSLKTKAPAAEMLSMGVSPELVYGEPAEVILANDPTLVSAAIRRWNGRLAVLYAAQAIAIACLGADRAVPVVTQYFAKDTLGSQIAGHALYAPATRQIFTLNVRYIVPAFLLISSITCALTAWNKSVFRRRRLARFIGQATSGAFATLAVAMLAGMEGISSLLAVFALSVVPSTLLLLVSQQDANRTRRSIWVGLGANGVVLVALAMFVFGANLYNGATPGFVYGALAILAVGLAGLFGMAMLAQRADGRWRNGWLAERIGLLVSLGFQTALAWVIFAGSLLHS